MRKHLLNTTAINAYSIAFANVVSKQISFGMVASLRAAAEAVGNADGNGAQASEDMGKRSKDSAQMLPYWDLTDDILSGYDAIKNAGVKYLPMFCDEMQADYDFRLQYTKFTNVFRDIVEGLASKPFEQEITLTKEGDDKAKVPAEISSFVENVDGAGNNITSFAAGTFFNGIASCIDWIFVDYPKVDRDVIKTKADQKANGIRPFWSHVLGRNVLEAKTAILNGNEQLIRMRILEPGTPNHIRLFEMTGPNECMFGLFRETISANGVKKDYILVDSGPISIGRIPLVPFYTGRREGRTFNFFPAMRDAADLQIKLYHQESGLNFAKVMAGYPMLAGNGIKPQMDSDGKTPKKIAVGPHRVLYSPPDGAGNVGNWEYVQPDAAVLKFLSDDIKETQQQLRELGRLPLTAQSGNLTVITTAFAAGKAKSAVAAWAYRLKDAIENALMMTAAWLELKDYDPQVNVYTEFDNFTDNTADLSALGTARSNRDISRVAYLNELKRRGTLSPEYNAEKDVEELLKETPDDEETELNTPPNKKPKA